MPAQLTLLIVRLIVLHRWPEFSVRTLDSSVVAALCVRAVGPGKVLGVLMPETDNDPDSLRSVTDRIGPVFGNERRTIRAQ